MSDSQSSDVDSSVAESSSESSFASDNHLVVVDNVNDVNNGSNGIKSNGTSEIDTKQKSSITTSNTVEMTPPQTERSVPKEETHQKYTLTAADERPIVVLTQRQVIITFIGLMLGMFLASLDSTVVATALPVIVSDFHSLNMYSWVIVSYLLTSTAFIPLTGKFSDLFGRKILFMSAMIVFLLGSGYSALSPSMISLIIARAIQGLGAGAIMSLTQIIIGDIVTVRERGKYSGFLGVTFAIASVLGPIIGGLITQNLSWRWIFYVNLPIGVIALIVVYFALHLPRPKDKKANQILKEIDYLGSLLIIGGVVLVLIAMSFGGNQYAWNSAFVIVLLCGGSIMLMMFIWAEHRAVSPLMPVWLFLIRNVSLSNWASFMLGFIMFGGLNYLPVYFQEVVGNTPTVSGLKLIPMMIGLIISSIISGILITKTGHFWIFPPVGCIIIVLTSALIGALLSRQTNIYSLSVILFFYGLGIGCCVQSLIVVVQAGVKRVDIGTATASNNFLRQMGGSVGVTIFGTILSDHLSSKLGPELYNYANAGYAVFSTSLPTAQVNEILQAYTRGIQLIFYSCIPFSVLALVLCLLIRNYKLPKIVLKKAEAAIAV